MYNHPCWGRVLGTNLKVLCFEGVSHSLSIPSYILFFRGDVLFKRIGEKDMKSDHLVLFGMMQRNDRDELEDN